MSIHTGPVHHLNSDGVAHEVYNAERQEREISDAAALTIASWWQSPRGSGLTFAALQAGLPVEVDAVHSAIADVYPSAGPQDRKYLDFLGTWAIHRAS